MTEESTRRDFLKSAASTPLLISSGEEGWIDEDGDGDYLDDIIGEDEPDKLTTKDADIYVGKESERGEVPIDDNNLFFAIDSGAWSRSSRENGWSKIETTGKDPKFRNASAKSLETDEASIKERPDGPDSSTVGKGGGLQPSVSKSLYYYEKDGYLDRRVTYQNGGVLYAVGQTTTGNVWKSTDNGSSWTSLTSVGAEIEQLIRVESTGTLIAIASNADLYRSTDDGSTWSSANTTALNYTPLGSNQICETPSGHILIGEYTSGSGSGSNTHRVIRSTDDGQSWSSTFSSDSSKGTDTDAGHIQGVQYDATEGKVVMMVDYPDPEIFESGDEGGTWTRIGTATAGHHPNYVSLMFFDSGIAWGVDGNSDDGYIYLLPRADFYAGNWDDPNVVAKNNFKRAYFAIEADADSWILSFASETSGKPGFYGLEYVLVEESDGKVFVSDSVGWPAVNDSAATGVTNTLPDLPHIKYDQTASGTPWINVRAGGEDSALSFSVGRQTRQETHQHYRFAPLQVNEGWSMRVPGSGSILSPKKDGTLTLNSHRGDHRHDITSGGDHNFIVNGSTEYTFHASGEMRFYGNDLRGPGFFDGISFKSSPPSPNSTTAVYMDDGTNHSSGSPGWRATSDGGSTWIDL